MIVKIIFWFDETQISAIVGRLITSSSEFHTIYSFNSNEQKREKLKTQIEPQNYTKLL